ncbi:MAG: efflux RND transporter permease subunit [Gemmatimonadaceae bacterium]|nr:efflux RND transporter permease subunit [Gemmatimonadaceae bacterium]MCW5826353.1 efflux RND transporter permease subunit [Gemmatimonadaceae bacterium]
MYISDFAIKRPLITIVSMLALVVFGLFALWRLETDEFPDVQQPIINVAIPYPGASPDVVEREVLDRVEEAVSGISGVDRIMGSAQDGFANITVFFVFEKDLQQASQDIRDKISGIRSDLPAEMKEPVLTRFDPADQPIIEMSLNSSTLDAASLTRIADPEITRVLRGIPGVAEAVVIGGVERELTVEIRPDAMEAAGISVAQLVGALQAQNIAAPVGRITGALDERSIRLKGKLETPEDFLRLVVAEKGGRAIRLGEVATARDGTSEPRTAAMFNGRDAVGISIKKSKGYSTTTVAERVVQAVDGLRPALPPGTTLDIVRNAGDRVRDSVANVQSTLVEGAILTVLVVFLFLNSWRSTVITGLALPISVLASFIAVWAFGFTLNTMSLLGLSLAIGILIDDAIVVRENIVRHVEMGKDHFRAAHEGTDEIGLAVAATTFSIVSVFVPIGFMAGLSGQWFKPFALTIACAVLVSLFVSFSLDPMLSAYWPDPEIESHEHRNWLSRQIAKFNDWFDKLAGTYTKVIGWALDHRLAIIALAGGSLFSALWLQGTFGGFGFVPVSDNSELVIQVETPPGSNLEYTRLKTEEAARLARAHSEVRYTFATVGAGGGMDPSEALGAVDLGSVYVRMTPKTTRELSQDQFGARLREEVKSIGGATVAVFTSGFGGAIKQVQLELRGFDGRQLQQVADTVLQVVRNVPGAVDVGLSTKGQKPELEITLDRALAGSLGVTVGQIAQSLRPAFAGVDAGDWVDPAGENRKVRVRLAPESRTRVSDIERLPISVGGQGGAPMRMVPLGQLATVTQGVGPAKISHLDRDNVIVVQANVAGSSLGEVTSAISRELAKMNIPEGVRWSFGGEAKDQEQVFGDILAALGIALLLMYLILVMQFGSFLEPIAILISLPLSLIGVVLALLITNDTLNIMSMIGVILLMGIVAKNAILLIDFAKWGQEQGMERRAAIIEAGRVRLRPILMTTFAIIAGMIPVSLGLGEGADFRAPLGRAVIGGTITSTILTLVVIPTVYEILDEWREKVAGWFKFPVRPKTDEYMIPKPRV